MLNSSYMLHGNCTRQCIRNKTFLFVKIESWNFQYLHVFFFHETSQNVINIFWLSICFVSKCYKNFYRINSETAFSLSQSHTAVDACDFKKNSFYCMACFLQLGVNFHKKVWQKVSSKLEILEKDNSNALKLFNSWNIY